MFAAAKAHLIEKISSATIQRSPFPHIVIENIFPQEFYAEIMRNMPVEEQYQRLVDTGRVSKGYSPARLCFFPHAPAATAVENDAARFWQTLQTEICDTEFMSAWVNLFKPEISAFAQMAVKAANNRATSVELRSELFLMRDKDTYSLGPHWDNLRKAVSVLFYLPGDACNEDLGTALYVPKDADVTVTPGGHAPFEFFECVKKIPYRANTVLAFPNAPKSFHGVEPVVGAHKTRDILLYDIKFKL